MIVLDGILYALGLLAASGVVLWLAGPLFAVPLWLLALFCLYFFRDPERVIPSGAVAVSPADGKVIEIVPEGPSVQRLTIFLNVFDVHVNRTPIAGKITDVRYQEGKFLVASRKECSEENEQNIVTVEGDGTKIIFKQIAGLIARRIVFNKKTGDRIAMGERIGLMKFGSRMDVLFGPEWEIVVKRGMRVAGRIDRDRAPARRGTKWDLESRWWIRARRIRRPRRAAYALPTLFTAGNIFLGYISILRSVRGAILFSNGLANPHLGEEHLKVAATAIGWAVFLDGLDGRIARMTNTTSDFGREMDSLADVVSFGIAPAVLAFVWGVQFVGGLSEKWLGELHNAGYFISFLFLLCGACRLARFNVQKNPVPKNPGRPDRKYFVGLPIPAGAAAVAAVVYATGAEPLTWWPLSVAWLGLQLLLGFLMVSTWRYYSGKGLNLSKPYTPLLLVLLGAFIYGMWNYSQALLIALAAIYVSSGIVIRIGGIVRRRFRHG